MPPNSRDPNNKQLNAKSVPSTRISRLGKMGALASSLTSNVVKHSFQSLVKAKLPSADDVLFSVDNAKSISKHLAHMRGAAMKVGQMLSMDAGEILPKEWEIVLSSLRDSANIMPKWQLEKVLVQNWGKNWQSKFNFFQEQPIAAASIGQVHKAQLTNGDLVAIKVQYPGVAESIDSDINNVMGLLKMTRLLPKGLDISGLIEQAKKQLKAEADYRLELKHLLRFKTLLAGDPRYIVPSAYPELSNEHILCMEYVDALPLVQLEYETKRTKQTIIESVFELVLCELFDYKFMQSDPNYANYLYKEDTKQLVLLDFGACQDISESASQSYLAMATAMSRRKKDDMLRALLELNLLDESVDDLSVNIVLDACYLASESLQSNVYNFKEAMVVKRLKDITQPLIDNKTVLSVPNFDVAMINRKVSGTVLLANKVGCDVRLEKLLQPYLIRA